MTSFFRSLRLASLAALIAFVPSTASGHPIACDAPSPDSEAPRIELDNGRLRVSVRLDSGGGIDGIGVSPRLGQGADRANLIDSFDRGRLVQQSYYGAEDGSLWNDRPWRWNPVQGGGWRGEPGTVLDVRRQANRLTIVTRPTHWATGEPIPQATMRQTIRLDGDLLRVRYEFDYDGSVVHPAHDQEIPAIFLAPRYDTLVTGPISGPADRLVRRRPGWPNEGGTLVDHWAAYVDASDWGLGVRVDAADRYTSYRYREAGEPSACSYVAPLTTLAIEPGMRFAYEAIFAVGTLEEIRSRLAAAATGDSEVVESESTATTNPSPESSRTISLDEYLTTDFDAEVTSVEVTADEVVVRGRSPIVAGRVLIEWPAAMTPQQAWSDAEASFPTIEPLEIDGQGRFEVRATRQVNGAEGRQRDRLFSRWGIATQTDGAARPRPVSHAHGVDRIEPLGEPSRPSVRGRKGLGALWIDRPLEDLETLGVSGVTVNVLLDTIIRSEPGEGREAFEFEGRTWYADLASLAPLDRMLQVAAERELLVSAIILVRHANQCADRTWGTAVAHPDATAAGIFVMPNVHSSAGIEAYGAALELLASRYSQVDAKFGRIHHWILHNEVNSGWVWTNAGEKSARDYVALLHRSLRLADTILREHDPAAQVFVSLDHHWTTRHDEHCFGSRTLLDELLLACRTEGDFPWAIAHHPYPQDLGDPRVWRDDQVTFDFDTPKVTFRNLEVLDAWVRQPRARYRGETLRTLHLTEQGLNSRGYGPEALLDQAAGMAYAWHKIERLNSIGMFHYHNWVDNRHEGGLQIGLRRFPDDADDPLGTKPIWHVYRALETPDQATATEFALERIGIGDWTELDR